MKYPVVSIIIPTYNSERLLPRCLRSIATQDYPQDAIELIAADGGSTDQTRAILTRAHVRIIDNKRKLPEYGKHEALKSARGSIVVFIDSDEELTTTTAISHRVQALQSNQNAKTVVFSGYAVNLVRNTVSDYINALGDPFSYFMYQEDATYPHKLEYWKKSIPHYQQEKNWCLFHIGKHDIVPLMDLGSGTTFDLTFLKQKYRFAFDDPSIINNLFARVARDTGVVIYLTNDPTVHHSASTVAQYLKKIHWRIVNNVHYQRAATTGYSNRETLQPRYFPFKKMLFIPYAFSFVLPLITGVRLAILKKETIFLIHPLLCWYTALHIVVQQSLHAMGITPKAKIYGT